MNAKTLYPLFFLCLLAGPSPAQEKDKLQERGWAMNEILQLSESTGVGNLAYTDKKGGLAFVNNEADLSQELSIPGRVLGIGKWKENILAFYVKEWENQVTKEIHAILVDVKTKAIVSDKVIYQNPGNDQIECKIAKDGESQFHYLLIRTTGLAGDPGKTPSDKEVTRKSTTKALEVLFLSDQLKPSLRSLSSAAISNPFLGTYTNKKGEIMVLSAGSGMLLAEKFGQGGELQKKLSTPLILPDNDEIWAFVHSLGRVDPNEDDRLAVSIQVHTRRTNFFISLVLFDFAGGKALTNGTTNLDKDFSKSIRNDPQMPNRKHFDWLEFLIPVSIDFIGDKILVLNEQQRIWSSDRNSTSYISEGGIESIYDRQLHLQHTLFIDRFYSCYIDRGRGYGSCIRDGKLLLLGNDEFKREEYQLCYFIIDPIKGSVEKKIPEWPAIKRHFPAETRSVFWFKKNIVMSHPSGNFIFKMKEFSYLTRIPYF